jgi:hypothetical protein
MKKLKTVTLLGIDCVDIDRLILAADICQENFEFADVKLLTSLPSKNKDVVKIKPIKSAKAYSRFIISQLDKYVDTPHVLIFQYDGFILNPKAWTDEFLKYDYIGAPWLVADWAVKHFDFSKKLLGKLVVGNGGFSLRSKKLISLCAKLHKQKAIERYHPEDTSIGVYNRKLMEKNGIEFAPVDLAKKFSFEFEDDVDKKWNGQFGFHDLKQSNLIRWFQKHGEYNLCIKKTKSNEKR